MKFKKGIAAIMAALIIASLAGCGTDGEGKNTSSEPVRLLDTSEMFSGRDIETGYDESECTVITLTGDSAKVSGEGATVKGSTVTISAEGEYLLSGKLDNGCLIIDADSKDKIRLILNGAEISSKTCAAVSVRQADKVFITLAKGSENMLSNTAGSKSEDEADAVIFSKDDLTINGEGKLTVTANTGHGIVSKDDLVITGGSYTVTSEKKGLDANDSIRIASGSFTIDAGTDALHCENDDSTKGYIYIADGSFSITAGTDGMDASGVIQIDNGSITLATGGGNANASTDKGGKINRDWGNWGGRGGRRTPSGGSSAETSKTSAGSGSESSSAKGLKSDSSIAVNNGSITIDSSDDAIHSDGQVTVADGSIAITSGDDGIHAGSSLQISGGTVNVSKSYEGLEGMTIDISGGDVSVTASDDGLNAAGGNDGSSVNGRPGQNQFAAQEGVYIRISGGKVTVNASGDGIDSNGDVTVSGGETYVSGSTCNGNAALDYNGEATVTGGVFIAAGMSGMAQNFGSKSTQGAMLVNVENQKADSKITLKDSDGKTLAAYQPPKSYNSIVVSTPDIRQGKTYTLTAGSAKVEVKMDSLLYGSGGGMGGGRMPGGDFQGGDFPGGGNSPGGRPPRGRG